MISLSTKLTRASAAALSSQTSTTASQCLASRSQHQRRPSSSKASCPPDSSKPTPAAKTTATTTAETAQSAQSAASKKLRSKYNKRFLTEKLAKTKEPVDQFAGLPVVPGVQLHKSGEFIRQHAVIITC